jgi:hypothetical protein
LEGEEPHRAQGDRENLKHDAKIPPMSETRMMFIAIVRNKALDRRQAEQENSSAAERRSSF